MRVMYRTIELSNVSNLLGSTNCEIINAAWWHPTRSPRGLAHHVIDRVSIGAIRARAFPSLGSSLEQMTIARDEHGSHRCDDRGLLRAIGIPRGRAKPRTVHQLFS